MKVLKFFGKFIAFIYSIAFFFILDALLLLICLSNLLNPKFYGDILKNLDLSQIKIVDILGDKTSDIEDKATTAEDFLVDQLEENGIPTESAKKIVTNKEVKELVGTFMGKVIQYYVFNKETPQIDSEQVNSILKEFNLEDELKENNIEIDSIVEKVNKKIAEKLPVENNEVTTKENTVPEELQILFQIANKGKLLLILASFIIFSYFFLALLTWSFSKPMNFMGIPTLIIGVLFLLLRFGSGLIISLLGDVEILSFIEQFSIILKPALITGISCLVIGLLLIVLYSNISSIKSKNSNDEPNFDIENEKSPEETSDIESNENSNKEETTSENVNEDQTSENN